MTKYTLFFTIFFLINIFNLAYSQENNNFYKIKIEINSQQRIAYAEAEIDIYNSSNINLNSLYFNLGLNNNYGTKINIKEVSNSNNKKLQGYFYKYEYLDDMKEDITIYKVDLDKPLESNSFIKLNFIYEITNFSKIDEIIFFDDSIYDDYNGSWYPRLINFRNNLWKKKDFVNNNYEVEVIVNSNENVVSSAFEIENQLLKLTQQKRYLYKINNSKNFSLAISNYIVPENRLIQNKINLKVYFKNNKGTKWYKKKYEIAEDIINFYYKIFDFYPYNQLSILPGQGNIQGGYSNSNFIVLNDYMENFKFETDVEKYISFYLSYFIAQQYTSFCINEISDNPKWISHGLALYLSYLYLKEKKIKDDYIREIISYYINASKSGFNTQIIRDYEEFKYGLFDWKNIIEKSKSFEIFKLLENIIGKKTFLKIILDFFKDYKNKSINTEIFTDFLEAKSNKNLKDFFYNWLYTSNYIDYAVTKVIQEKKNNKFKVKIYIKKLGQIESQMPILITLRSGAKVFNFYDGKQKEAELIYEYNEPVTYVEIDYFNNIPDINKSNNKIGVQ
ncbi:MAG: hypothetical protein KatS3mg068_1321 [Candidatus Sericytochromatia bacterium]|nr:MAG: hypothetical protein KatS3mg068_1321 [Candidatus Sericytochromatia bacterium]